MGRRSGRRWEGDQVSHRIAVVLLSLVVLLSVAGCAPPSPDTAAPRGGSAPRQGTERPTVAQAEDAVLRIASETYPEAPWDSVRVEGMGLDGAGLWWVQAWTSTGREGDESEQWFVTYDGESWEYQDSGTGMSREDYPDVVWEDVE